jgi:hypothetical protein
VQVLEGSCLRALRCKQRPSTGGWFRGGSQRNRLSRSDLLRRPPEQVTGGIICGLMPPVSAIFAFIDRVPHNAARPSHNMDVFRAFASCWLAMEVSTWINTQQTAILLVKLYSILSLWGGRPFATFDAPIDHVNSHAKAR